ncbi:ABC transporter, putative [Entamoeba histolytica HM-3:IMSS]|uniref:ABC transporter, putative n=1 Tax=Entamoeba histolytica HM-3:IMSS TaxID=885315 RepID=M7X2V1_ENTHI|nr:ABC transporter, putative [Entamoeba histolytica HM-3:IMSS]
MSNSFQCFGEFGFITSKEINPCFENYILFPLLSFFSILLCLYYWKTPSLKEIKSKTLFNLISFSLIILLIIESLQYPHHLFLVVISFSLFLLYHLSDKVIIFYLPSSLFCIICCFHQHTSPSLLRLLCALLSSIQLLYILFFSPKQGVSDKNLLTPKYSLNLINKWTYSFITPLLSLAQSRLLNSSDLPELPREVPVLEKQLKKSSLMKAIFVCYFPRLLMTVPYFIIMIGTETILPVIQKHILMNLEQNKSILWLSLCMLFIPLISAFVRQRNIYLSSLIHVQIKKELTDIVFNKLLIVQHANNSKIVNILNIDIDRVVRFLVHIFDLIDIPVSLIICSFMLYDLVGTAALYGIIGLFICVPITLVIASYQRKMRFELMQLRDNRGKITNELLSNIRGVKLEGLVDIAQQRVECSREIEQKLIRKLSVVDGCMFGITRLLPAIISMITFSVALRSMELSSSIAFTTLSVFQMLQHPLSFLPLLVLGLTEAKVAIERIEKFLNKKEYEGIKRIKEEDNTSIKLKGSFGYKDKMILNDINLEIQKGKLVMVIGQVGCGKTTLLNAILGECKHNENSFNGINGSIGFISSTPWLRNDTVQGNICMGNEYNEERFNTTISLCQLEPDIKIFHDGIKTQIGERGITLSGGQKQRIALARVIYKLYDIYLIDDVLSAVDPNVSVKLFKDVIQNELKEKTRVLCTHQLQYLPYADQIIVLENHQIVFNGNYDDFIQTEFMNTLKDMKELTKTPTTLSPIPIKKEIKTLNPLESPSHLNETSNELMTKETIESGIIKESVFKKYIQSVGGLPSIIIYLCISFAVKGSSTLSDYMLTYNPIPLLYYFILQLISVIFTLLKSIIETRLGTKATTTLHNSMFYHVIHSPFIFFDTTPIGRILNRFTKDIETMDTQLKRVLSICILQVLTIIFVLLLNLLSSILFMPLLIILSYVYISIIIFYIDSSQNLQRLQSTTKSPILSIISEIVPGLFTIRAQNLNQLLFDQQSELFDIHQRTTYSNSLVDRWLCLRVDCIGAFVMFGSVIAASLGGASVAGLAISYAMNVTRSLVFLIKTFSDVQSSFVSVERVLEYCELQTEEDIDQQQRDSLIDFDPLPITNNKSTELNTPQINVEDLILNKKWPIGNIEFKHITMKYRKELPDVLKDISFNIHHGEKIGVCGRTGSGKSSLLQVLFKTVSNVSGTVMIDEVPLNQIPHHILREQIGIIPQDPLVFQGTIRENIDPFKRKSDKDIYQILQDMSFDKEFKGLDDLVEENGKNLSSGTKQLLCIARECLRDSKIICIDEATSGVDYETDQCIQKSIRTFMKDKTVITIAHRIYTIIDYDRIIVMDNGIVQEFDTPQNLLNNTNSLFYSFVKQQNEEH